jgi:hypothetical protein
MIHFENETFIMEIKNFTVEDWLKLHSELCYAIRWLDCEKISNDFYAIADFLGHLMPRFEDARKMEIN